MRNLTQYPITDAEIIAHLKQVITDEHIAGQDQIGSTRILCLWEAIRRIEEHPK